MSEAIEQWLKLKLSGSGSGSPLARIYWSGEGA